MDKVNKFQSLIISIMVLLGALIGQINIVQICS